MDGLSLTEQTVDGFTLQYPTETWSVLEGSDPLSFLYYAPMDGEHQTNINIQVSADSTQVLTEKDLTSLVVALKTQGIDPSLAELRIFNNTVVVYMEGSMEITDTLIDLMIEQGAWTEELIESIGGRDVLKAIPATDQIYLYVPVDGTMMIYIGSYYQETEKEVVLNAMKVMAQTTQAAK